jgi:hypothetical protein
VIGGWIFKQGHLFIISCFVLVATHNSAQMGTKYITLVATYNLVGKESGFAGLHQSIRYLEGAKKWRRTHNLVGGKETIRDHFLAPNPVSPR